MQNPPGLSGEDFCKSPDGGSEYNSHIADFTTDFHKQYRDAIVDFLGKTKMDMLETDVSRHDTTDQRCTLPRVPVQQGRCGQGPYEGATCAPTNNSGFSHVNNSQVGAEPLTPPPHARTAAPVLAQVCRLLGSGWPVERNAPVLPHAEGEVQYIPHRARPVLDVGGDEQGADGLY